jgi:hypothetical protein
LAASQEALISVSKHLTTMSVSMLFIVDDRMINEPGSVGGMKISMETNYPEEIRRSANMSIKLTYELTQDRTRVAMICSR